MKVKDVHKVLGRLAKRNGVRAVIIGHEGGDDWMPRFEVYLALGGDWDRPVTSRRLRWADGRVTAGGWTNLAMVRRAARAVSMGRKTRYPGQI